MDSKDLGWALFLGGIVAAGFGSFILYRHKTLSGSLGFFEKEKPKGRLVTEFWKPTPIVEENKLSNGMKIQHRRSSSMSIEERIANLQDLIWKSVTDPEMRKLALAITNKCPERDGKCEAEAVYKYIKKNVRYTGDVAPIKIGGRNGPLEPIDLYQSAKRTISFHGGDCDDHAIANAVLLTLNGITARLRVTAETKNSDWGHVYCGALLPKINGGKFYALDTTLPGNNNFGKEVPYAKYLDFPV